MSGQAVKLYIFKNIIP